jgi:alpha-beta hydrolase superfamily lysophospholipase
VIESFRSGSLTLACHLKVPSGSEPGRRPAAILCHGFPSGRSTRGVLRGRSPSSSTESPTTSVTSGCRSTSGAGKSAGDFSLQGWVDDLRSAIDFVCAETHPAAVVLIGRNTGGSIAMCVGADDPRVRAAALLSPRADFDDWAAQPRRFLEHAREIGAITTPGFPASFEEWSRAFRRFRPIDAARRFAPRPLLVMHDESVPTTDVRQLATAHGSAELLSIFVGAGHRLRHDPRAVAVLFGWLERVRAVDEQARAARAS